MSVYQVSLDTLRVHIRPRSGSCRPCRDVRILRGYLEKFGHTRCRIESMPIGRLYGVRKGMKVVESTWVCLSPQCMDHTVIYTGKSREVDAF